MCALRLVTLTPPGLPAPSLAIAGSRAGGVGVLDLEYGVHTPAARQALKNLCRYAGNDIGLKLHSQDLEFLQEISPVPDNLKVVILTHPSAALLKKAVDRLHPQNIRIFPECTSIEEAQLAERAGVDGVIAKGQEAGGRIGNETTFILLQRFLKELRIPVWAQGGIGLHTAAACSAAGAQGVILDSQLALLRESPLPEAVKARISALDGTETVVLGEDLGECYRVCGRLGIQVIKELQATEKVLVREGVQGPEAVIAWRRALAERVGWSSTENQLFPAGQDLGFASALAHRFETVGGVLEAIRLTVERSCRSAALTPLLAEGSPLARAHGTRYPIVQGPMARVSDNPAFVSAVAQNGALPFVAAAWLRPPELDALLQETKGLLQGKPWGVGLLGFLAPDHYQEQVTVVLAHRPPFALIAGGNPEQAQALEREGIRTYVHIPSPGLLQMFLKDGAQRLVFEGRESGGHVGPLCSFVLFETMINQLLESLPAENQPSECHVLFAGGIHDDLSAAMVAVMAAPLAERGVRVGFQLGSAYLFTEEAVSCGAIVRPYLEKALRCEATTLLVSGPGHAERCIGTPFTRAFQEERRRLVDDGVPMEIMRASLERLKLGRLRIATKGIGRNPAQPHHPQAAKFMALSEQEQDEQGLYMVGQLAALRNRATTMAALHQDISVKGATRLEALQKKGANSLPHGEKARPSDIAIIGMACLLPQAPSVARYWENILNKVNAIREIPPERWDWRLYYDPDQRARDRICSKWGAFLEDIPFDPTRYGIAPNSLWAIEPLQLLALEVTRWAINDAGYAQRPFPRERTGVILGISGVGGLGYLYNFRTSLPLFFGERSGEILANCPDTFPEWTEDSFPGILMNVAAGRIANRFNLGGTNCTVDAACASSLAAVYWAVNELETRMSDMMIVGGADCMQDPFTFMCFSKTHALSPRGRCQSLDEKADGIVIGEGLVVMVLKRLADAERDGDCIYAVIKGLGASSDGRDKSLTAPRREGQILALERAYAKAGVSPGTVGLVEAHATGTTLGDRIEIEALNQVFLDKGAREHSCALGSVKPMIGHTKSSAGMASLLKTALALYHKALPPTLGVESPNPALKLPGSPFYVNTEARPWLNGAAPNPRRAGVSAIGFGGTNFHAVLEEYTEAYLPRQEASFQAWPAELLVWQRGSRRELLAALGDLEEVLNRGAELALEDLSFTLASQLERQRLPGKETPAGLALVVSSSEDLRGKLHKAGKALAEPHPAYWDPAGIYFTDRPLAPKGKVAFLFPGQGSEYVDMLADLAVQFPELQKIFEQSDRILEDKLPRPLSSFIFPPSPFSEAEKLACKEALAETLVAQPAMGAANLAMFTLLQNLGIRPEMVTGHSYGEYVALCAARVFGEDDLMALSEARARFMMAATGSALGAMAAVNAGRAVVGQEIEGLQDLWIANLNSPQQTVITGSRRAIDEAMQIFGSQGIQVLRLQVSCAFHSPFMAPAAAQLKDFLASLRLHPPQVPVFANATGTPFPAEPEAIADLLARQLVSQVEFVRTVESMYGQGARIFVEVGPGRVLSGLVPQILGERPHLAASGNQAGRSGLLQLHHLLGQLIVHGLPVTLGKLFQGRAAKEIDLKASAPEACSPSYSSSTWLVNGGRARPWKVPRSSPARAPVSLKSGYEFRDQAEPARANLPPQGSTGSWAPQEPCASPLGNPFPAVSEDAIPAMPSGNGASEVMVRYQRLMKTFLETQKRLMMGYFSDAAANTEGLAAPEAGSSRGLTPAPPFNEAPLPEQAAPVVQESSPEPVFPKGAESAGTASPQPPSGLSINNREALTAFLLQCVSERTGYPPEMLSLDLDLEADLGIDSIKRVEILSYFMQAIFPGKGGAPEPDGLRGARTLKELLIQVEEGRLVSEAAPAAETLRPILAADLPEPELLPRFTLAVVPAPPVVLRNPAADRVILVTDDGRGIARDLTEKMRRRGLKTALIGVADLTDTSEGAHYTLEEVSDDAIARLLETIRQRQGDIGGLIHLLPLKPGLPYDQMTLADWQGRLRLELQSLFYLLKHTASEIKSAAKAGWAPVVAATGMGGDFAVRATPGQDHFFPGNGGVVGLLKTLQVEWPDVHVKAVDLNLEEPGPDLADHIFTELAAGDKLLEVGYQGGRRLSLDLKEAPLAHRSETQLRMDSSWVILITGGARGITANVALELAQRYRPTLILAGSSPLPTAPEPQETASLTQPQELKAALIAARQRRNETVRPAEVQAACHQLLKDREIRANLAAMREAGAKVKYFAVDVRDELQFGRLIDELYQTYERLDGVIHGAGIIEDKLFETKTWESFARVLETKTGSAFILSRKLRPSTLKFLVWFSSVAGRFGNRGQGDYTAANEVINKLAGYLDRRWPGRVVALNWGPWEKSGMVTPELVQEFGRRGVRLIPPAAGSHFLDLEIQQGDKGEVEVVVGDGPWGPITGSSKVT